MNPIITKKRKFASIKSITQSGSGSRSDAVTKADSSNAPSSSSSSSSILTKKKKVRINPALEISRAESIPSQKVQKSILKKVPSPEVISSSSSSSSAMEGEGLTNDAEQQQQKSQAKLNNKQLKKLKQKRKLQKKKKALQKKKQEPPESEEKEEKSQPHHPHHHRDFINDLTDYLKRWELQQQHQQQQQQQQIDHEAPSWKFNKILQEWAIQHCLDKELISSELFKRLVPYLFSVEGKAKDRLIERLQTTIVAKETDSISKDPETLPEKNQGEKEDEAVLLTIAKKRATRLLKLFEIIPLSN